MFRIEQKMKLKIQLLKLLVKVKVRKVKKTQYKKWQKERKTE